MHPVLMAGRQLHVSQTLLSRPDYRLFSLASVMIDPLRLI